MADFETKLVQGEVVICGIVLAEVLSGIKNMKEAQTVKTQLLALPYLSERRSTFIKAADIYSSLRKKGTTVPLSDCIISAVVMENKCKLLTNDKHFREIPGLDEWIL